MMHDLGCNFGIGAESMFYGDHTTLTAGPEGKDAYTDRFSRPRSPSGIPGSCAAAAWTRRCVGTT